MAWHDAKPSEALNERSGDEEAETRAPRSGRPSPTSRSRVKRERGRRPQACRSCRRQPLFTLFADPQDRSVGGMSGWRGRRESSFRARFIEARDLAR
jgi:hypothetical protein